MQVIGLCRFSYPGLGGFQVEHESLDERIAYLYDPTRMEERFRLFECFTLPCLRAQTDADFTFLIVIGETLPKRYRARLDALVSDIPQVLIQEHPPGKHRAVMREAINSVRRFDKVPCLQFRLDDDDAVGIHFVEDLRTAADRVQQFGHENNATAIDFNTGYIARPGPHGIDARAVQEPYWTSALALMMAPKTQLTVMNFSHAILWRKIPTVTLTGFDMLLRGYNDYNDSRQKPGIKHPRLITLDAEGEAHFRSTYNIDADHVRAVFAAN